MNRISVRLRLFFIVAPPVLALGVAILLLHVGLQEVSAGYAEAAVWQRRAVALQRLHIATGEFVTEATSGATVATEPDPPLAEATAAGADADAIDLYLSVIDAGRDAIAARAAGKYEDAGMKGDAAAAALAEAAPLVGERIASALGEATRLVDKAAAERRRAIYRSIGVSFVLFWIAMLPAYLAVRHFQWVLRALTLGAEQFGRRNFAHRIDIYSRDELGRLAGAFNDMADELTSSMIDRNYVMELLEHVPECLLIVDSSGNIERANRAALNLLGSTAADVTGKPFAGFVAEDARGSLLRAKSGALIPVQLSVGELTDETRGTTVRIVAGRDLRPARAMQEREHALVNAAAEERVASLHRLLKRELEIAAALQTSLLPRTVPIAGLELAAAMVPASEIGGDYYDVLALDDGCWISIGDVAGHGLHAGIIMLMVQSIIASLASGEKALSPGEVLERANAILFDNVHHRLRRGEHVTLSLLRYSLDGTFTVAGAHQDLLICRVDGTSEQICVDGTWLGLVERFEHGQPSTIVRLAPGDVMLLYTDGITEAMDGSGEQFGVDRLAEMVTALRSEPAGAIVDAVLSAARTWAVEQSDDMTAVAVRYLGEAARVEHAPARQAMAMVNPSARVGDM